MKLRMFPPTSTMGQTSQTTSFCPAISFLVPLLTSNQGMRDSDACSACQSHGNPSWHSRFLPTPSDSGWCSLFKHFEVYRCSSLGSVKLGPVIGGIELTTQARLQEKVQRLGPIVGLLCRFGSLAGNVITPTSLTEDVWKHLFANLRKSKRLEIHSLCTPSLLDHWKYWKALRVHTQKTLFVLWNKPLPMSHPCCPRVWWWTKNLSS